MRVRPYIATVATFLAGSLLVFDVLSVIQIQPDRFELMLPPATEMFRGLLARFHAGLIVHFENGNAVNLEMSSFQGETACDPLPPFLDLEKRVFRWAHSLSEWRSVRLDSFQLPVNIEFEIDKTLSDKTVIYRVEYHESSPDPFTELPERIVITAGPGDVEGWKQSIKAWWEHEEGLKRLREKKQDPVIPE